MDRHRFTLAEGGFEGKQFGLNAEETLKFANWDLSAVAVLEVQLPKSILDSIGDFTSVDRFIFKSGTVTITKDVLDIFNDAIMLIKEKY